MARLLYFHQPDEAPASPLGDDSDGWGASLCGAVAIALAASVVPVQPARADDDFVPPPAASVVEEESWQQPVVQQPPQFLISFADRDDAPAGSLFGQPDEDFDPRALLGPPRPALASFYQPLPYLPDPEEVPAGSLRGQPDEDLWRNPVAPTAASFYQRLPLGDPEELPAGSLFGQPDEDFWVNPVPPAQGSLYQRLPLGDPEEVPAGALYGQPDEDFWRAPAPQAQASPRPAFSVDDDLPVVAATPLPFDEEPWWNQVAPVPPSFARLLLPDAEEIPAGSLFVLVGPPDEDYWQNQVPPGAGAFYQRLPIGDPEEVPAGSLRGQSDEDFDVRLVVRAPTPASFAPLYFYDTPELAVPPAFDEDYWQNRVAPIPATFARLLLPDAEEIPAATLRGMPDEDFDWRALGPRPVPGSFYIALPLLPDRDELPGNLFLVPFLPVAVASQSPTPTLVASQDAALALIAAQDALPPSIVAVQGATQAVVASQDAAPSGIIASQSLTPSIVAVQPQEGALPTQFNFTGLFAVPIGNTKSIPITATRSDGTTPINLTGASLKFTIRDVPGSTAAALVMTFGTAYPLPDATNFTIVSAVAGTLLINLKASGTKSLRPLAAFYSYDLEVTENDGTVSTILEGQIDLQDHAARGN